MSSQVKVSEIGIPKGNQNDEIATSQRYLAEPIVVFQNNQSPSVENPETEKYGETKYRWFVMVAFFTLTFANGLQWVTFSSCADNFSEAYNMPSWKVNMFSLMYMIIYPFVCIPEGWLVDSYSTRLGLMIASGFTLAGAAFKLLINKSMAFAFIGQFCAGFFQPAILNSPGKIAANWFREDMRTLITTILCLSDTIGILVGFVFHVPIIDDKHKGDDFKKDFWWYVFYEFILNVVFCVPMFFVTKNKPDIPPSPSQNVDHAPETPGLVKSLKLLFTNIRFVYLLIVTFFVVGYYDVYSTIINSYFGLYGISDSKSSYIYAISSVVGMVSSIIVSYVTDKTQKFKLIMVILAITGMVFQSIFTLLLELSVDHKSIHAFATALIMYSLCNAIVIPFYTIGMNYACEITYPVGESINGGIMMSMSQVSGISGTFLCDHLINHNKKKYLTNVILLGFFFVSSIFVFLFDEKLDRHEHEKDAKEKDSKKIIEDNKDEDKDNKDKLDNPQTNEVKENKDKEDNEDNDSNKNIAINLLKA